MNYLWRRLALAPLLLLTVSFLTFWSLRLIGSNADIVRAILNTNYTEANAKILTEELGLNRPFFVQYFSWVGGFLHGDFGTSFFSRQSVGSVLKTAFPTSLELVILALLLALMLSIPLGIFAAYRPGSRVDRAIAVTSFGLLSLPGFVVGIILLFTFAVRFNWFPAGNAVPITEDPFQALKHLFLPALALALGQTATFQRTLRTDMVNSLQEDYVTLAKSKGLSDRYILLRHALRPSSFTLLTLAGVNFGALIGNALIVETLFTLPGMGRTIVQALIQRDIPTVLGGVVVITLVFIIATTIVDLMYGVLDPRVRHARAAA